MLPDDPSRRPIVACRVEHDGAATLHLRVYCPRDGASVPVRACEACAAHIELPAGAESGFVRCGPTADEACQHLAETPPIGALVTAPVHAVRESASLSSAAALLADAGAQPVLVVDPSGACVGALSRMEVLRRAQRFALDAGDRSLSAHDAMGEATVAMETASVRAVLRKMAVHRLRFLAIVAEDGTPLGVISDIEALRIFSALRG